jgi:hypothetical protein
MMTKKVLLALSLAALATGALAGFSEADTDGDGMLNAEEAEAAGIDMSAADTNGDGMLSQEEATAAMGE